MRYNQVERVNKSKENIICNNDHNYWKNKKQSVLYF